MEPFFSWKLDGDKVKRISGFTLIELMIVVAIIAILAAIALPAYQDYVGRSQMAEGFILASGAKGDVAQFYGANSRMPANNAQANLPAASSINGKYVEKVVVASGAITATMRASKVSQCVQGKSVTLSPVAPNVDLAPLRWICTSDAACKPASC